MAEPTPEKPFSKDEVEQAYRVGFKQGVRAASDALQLAMIDLQPPPYQKPTPIEDLVGLWKKRKPRRKTKK